MTKSKQEEVEEDRIEEEIQKCWALIGSKIPDDTLTLVPPPPVVAKPTLPTTPLELLKMFGDLEALVKTFEKGERISFVVLMPGRDSRANHRRGFEVVAGEAALFGSMAWEMVAPVAKLEEEGWMLVHLHDFPDLLEMIVTEALLTFKKAA